MSTMIEREQEIKSLQEMVSSLTSKLKEREKHMNPSEKGRKGTWYIRVIIQILILLLGEDFLISDTGGYSGLPTEPLNLSLKAKPLQKESIIESKYIIYMRWCFGLFMLCRVKEWWYTNETRCYRKVPTSYTTSTFY